MTFPTIAPRWLAELVYKQCFNAREGLVTFPTTIRFQQLYDGAVVIAGGFQCPRGLGDFSHRHAHPRAQ